MKNKVGWEKRDKERRIKIEVKHRKQEKWASPLFVVMCESPTICRAVRKTEYSSCVGRQISGLDLLGHSAQPTYKILFSSR